MGKSNQLVLQAELSWLRSFISSVLALFLLFLTACGEGPTDEVREGELRQDVSKEADGWSEVQRIWRLKEQKGQGCEGDVLSGGALRDVVVGKQHVVVYGGVTHDLGERRSYDPDGTLTSSLISRVFPARYIIDGSLLCSRVKMPSSYVDSCFRLIKAPNGKMMEERLVALGQHSPEIAQRQELSCIELEINELGATQQ